MNKRGAEIPIIVLFLVALLFGGTTILILHFSNNDYGDRTKHYNEIMNEGDFSKDYVEASAELIIKEAVSCNENSYGGICSLELKERMIKIAEKKDIKYIGAGNFFLKMNRGEFEISEGEKGKRIFTMDGLFVLSEREGNKLKRNFNLRVEFDDSGESIRFINVRGL